jgi:hypothetical protein
MLLIVLLHVQTTNQHTITVVALCQKMGGHPQLYTDTNTKHISSPPSWPVSKVREIFQMAKYQHHKQRKI